MTQRSQISILAAAVLLFAFSTMISWSYYGLKAWTYIFGESRAADLSYKAVFCFFVIVGSAISAKSVFDFGDDGRDGFRPFGFFRGGCGSLPASRQGQQYQEEGKERRMIFHDDKVVCLQWK